jgi:hypothetical protein
MISNTPRRLKARSPFESIRFTESAYEIDVRDFPFNMELSGKRGGGFYTTELIRETARPGTKERFNGY